jgi:biotin carboxyl carrier protein
MQRRFRISVDGQPYEVVVEEIADAGAPTAWPASVAVASAATVAAAAPVKVDAKAGDEVAPLAGTIQSIDVTPGQTVKVGDPIVVIEAMKMKTAVHAKGAGKVVAIAVKVGDAVDTGAVLVTIA